MAGIFLCAAHCTVLKTSHAPQCVPVTGWNVIGLKNKKNHTPNIQKQHFEIFPEVKKQAIEVRKIWVPPLSTFKQHKNWGLTYWCKHRWTHNTLTKTGRSISFLSKRMIWELLILCMLQPFYKTIFVLEETQIWLYAFAVPSYLMSTSTVKQRTSVWPTSSPW